MPALRSKKHRTLQLSRRGAVRLMGGAGAAAWFGAHGVRVAAGQEPPISITVPDSGASLPTEEVIFRWLESGPGPKIAFWEEFFSVYQEAHPNITVQYEGLPWNEIAQIVPIGVQNGNAPDVFQIPLNIPHAQAVNEGWVAPLDDIIPDFAAWKEAFPPDSFLPGLTVFNGKTYGLPLVSNRQYGTLTLYNRAYMERAGYDPTAQPLTWDEFRAAARTITEQGQGQYYGLIFEGNQPNRFGEFVSNLGRMAGASAGGDDIDYRTGQHVYASDEYLAALDLLLALKADGSVFPGSMSLNAHQARAQMPQGAAGIILQGAWNITQWHQDNPDFEFHVASQPLPTTAELAPLTVGPPSGYYWAYARSPYGAIAGDIFHYLGTTKGQEAWGKIVGVGAPPIFPAAQQMEGTDPLEAKAYDLFDQQLRYGPDPRVRNPDAAQVYVERRNLQPDFGQTVQGIFTGQLEDARRAMQDLQDRANAELDRAIAAAQANGAQVSRDDWGFPNWDPAQDYTEADYAALT